jgi:hypothetical protein
MRKSAALLASVAALVTTGAVAADLPSKKAAPVQYVRICSTYGEGFFYIPGTETCIRIGGRAAYEWNYAQPYSRGDSTTGTRATGRIFLDARTATEYGLLRAFVRYDVQRRNGSLFSGTSRGIGTAFTGTGVDFNGVAQTEVALNRAFVQLGGLTAGRSQSFFDFYAGDLEYVGTTAGSSIQTNLLAYTATFGQGFSIALSIEDPVERRNVIGPIATQGRYAGSGMPDFVGVLRVEQDWGVAQLSGALHQVRAVGTLTPAGVVGSAPGFAPGTEYGYAFNAGVQFNLPWATGDQLWLQATYAKGASTYINSNPFGYAFGGGGAVGGLAGLLFPDAFVVPNGGAGSLSLPTMWGLTAAVQHYWTPTIRQALFGSYIKAEIPGSAFLAANAVAPGPLNPVRDFDYWTIGTNVTWSPVKDLDIGAEINYLKFSTGNGGIFSAVTGDPVTKIFRSDSAIVGRLKIQRDF